MTYTIVCSLTGVDDAGDATAETDAHRASASKKPKSSSALKDAHHAENMDPNMQDERSGGVATPATRDKIQPAEARRRPVSMCQQQPNHAPQPCTAHYPDTHPAALSLHQNHSGAGGSKVCAERALGQADKRGGAYVQGNRTNEGQHRDAHQEHRADARAAGASDIRALGGEGVVGCNDHLGPAPLVAMERQACANSRLEACANSRLATIHALPVQRQACEASRPLQVVGASRHVHEHCVAQGHAAVGDKTSPLPSSWDLPTAVLYDASAMGGHATKIKTRQQAGGGAGAVVHVDLTHDSDDAAPFSKPGAQGVSVNGGAPPAEKHHNPHNHPQQYQQHSSNQLPVNRNKQRQHTTNRNVDKHPQQQQQQYHWQEHEQQQLGDGQKQQDMAHAGGQASGASFPANNNLEHPPRHTSESKVCSQDLPQSCKRARPPANGNGAHIYMQLLEAQPAKDNLHLGRYYVLHCML